MASVLRGEIRWAALDPTVGSKQQGTRPVLTISHDDFNERSGTALAITITLQPQRAGYPLTLRLGKLGGKEAMRPGSKSVKFVFCLPSGWGASWAKSHQSSLRKRLTG